MQCQQVALRVIALISHKLLKDFQKWVRVINCFCNASVVMLDVKQIMKF